MSAMHILDILKHIIGVRSVKYFEHLKIKYAQEFLILNIMNAFSIKIHENHDKNYFSTEKIKHPTFYDNRTTIRKNPGSLKKWLQKEMDINFNRDKDPKLHKGEPQGPYINEATLFCPEGGLVPMEKSE